MARVEDLDHAPAPAPAAQHRGIESTAAEIVIRQDTLDGFVWPPASDAPSVPPCDPPQPQDTPGFLGTLLESIETTLLGRTALSFARRAHSQGWSPEPQGAYCWRCGGGVGPHEMDGEGCGSCRNTKLHWDQAVRLGAYDGLIRDAVLDLKFRRWRTSGHELGRSLGKAIRWRMERIGLSAGEVVLVPVPVAWSRRVARGMDHTVVLARAASRVIGCRYEPILRARRRREQVGLSMTARGENVRGAFRVRGRFADAKGLDEGLRALVLVDDVRTTGATLTAASKALRGRGVVDSGVEIWVSTAGVSSLGARDRRGLKNSGSGGADF